MRPKEFEQLFQGTFQRARIERITSHGIGWPEKVTIALRDAVTAGCQIGEAESFVRVTGPEGPHVTVLAMAGFKRLTSRALHAQAIAGLSPLDPYPLPPTGDVWEWRHDPPPNVFERAMDLIQRFEDETGRRARFIHIHPEDWQHVVQGAGDLVRYKHAASGPYYRLGHVEVIVNQKAGRMVVTDLD